MILQERQDKNIERLHDQDALQHENKEVKSQLSKSNEDLKKEQTKTHELNQKLYICKANQGVSTTFNISCQFVKINDEYSCETQDITINHKNMQVNQVIGSHIKNKFNQHVTELSIANSSMSYLSNDIFKTFTALEILIIYNASMHDEGIVRR